MSQPPFHASVEDILRDQKVDIRKGLSDDEVLKRRDDFGLNELEHEERTPLWKLVLEQFDDKLVQILLFAALLSFGLAFFEEVDHWLEAFVEPGVILLILIINAFVGVWQESNAENALEALKKMQSLHTPCLRDGVWQDQLPTEELVPGDVVKINVGDKAPADVRLCTFITATLRADEGALTGESNTVLKTIDACPAKDQGGEANKISDQQNMVFSGTTISGGKSIGVVCETGMTTEIGKIQEAVTEAGEEQEKTPLTQKLDEFGDLLTQVITGICVLVWIMNYQQFFDPVFGGVFKGCIYYLKIAVALGVAAIPEGLPAVITLCLALGTKKMVKRNAIVRKLPSVETLGCCTVICSDKTGTLTTNQMAVRSVVLCGKKGMAENSVTGDGYNYNDGAVQAPAQGTEDIR